MATKPTVSTQWAIGVSALKFNPTAQQRTWGWTTSNNLTTGVPEKPTLQHQNGWQYNVHLWLQYLEQVTDENSIPSQATHAGKFLSTNGSVLSWQSVDALPPQAGNSGLFLGTNGSVASWASPFPVQTGNSGKFLSTNGTAVSWENVIALPTQTGNAGKFLTTDGTNASWVFVFPDQTGNSGKFLTTNGSAVSWASVDALPPQTGNSGKFLTTNGTVASWATVDSLPSQTGNAGKFLQTNGTTASWQVASLVSVLTAAASGSIAIDMSLYNMVNATALTGAATFSFTNITPGRAVTILTKTTSGSFGLTWPSGMNWADGVTLPIAFTSVSAVTVVALGTTAASLYVTFIKQFVSV